MGNQNGHSLGRDIWIAASRGDVIMLEDSIKKSIGSGNGEAHKRNMNYQDRKV